MTAPRVYFIGNTHIDHTWLWNWTEGYDEVKASWQSALQRMEEFPEFVFTASSTLHYQWLEEQEPALFAQIQARVAEGRWQLAGGWVVQADDNLPCGEAFCRQGLYGQRYFLSRFGKPATVGYCVDSFGHHGQLPQILRLQGLSGWLHFRPGAHQLTLPASPYRWRGIDGTEVTAYRPPSNYCTWGSDYTGAFNELPAFFAQYPAALVFYGVGDHGGGPTIRDLQSMRVFRADHPEFDSQYGGLDDFYTRAAQASLPAVEGELQYVYRGCYTAHSRSKALNRQAEGRLALAEWAAAMATMTTGAAYPAGELTQAWMHVLTNHFHDIMAGTCTPEAMDEACHRYAGVLEVTDRLRHFATKRLSARFDGRAPAGYRESLAVCAVNALSWPRQELIEFTAAHNLAGREISQKALVDGEGQPVDYQLSACNIGTSDNTWRVLFAPTLPAGGAALFHVVQQEAPRDIASDLLASKDGLENRWWRLRLDSETGAVCSLFDKTRGLELIPRGARANDLQVMADTSDTWGTNWARWDRAVGRFAQAQIRVLETGPLRARLEVRRQFGLSTSYETIDLFRDVPYVEFNAAVAWNDAQKLVKITFPLALSGATSWYEIPYGALERAADGAENPLQQWVRVDGAVKVDGQPYSVGIAADSLGAADVLAEKQRGTLRLTLLRSPAFGDLFWQDAQKQYPELPITPDRRIVDQGETRRVRYRLLAGGGDLGLPEHAAMLSQPVQFTFEGAQPGETRAPISLFACTPATVHLTALKQAEDGDGFIARLVETRGLPTAATLTGPAGYPPIHTRLRPYEIQSWRWRNGATAVMCDLLER